MKTQIFVGYPNGQHRNGAVFFMEPCNRAMRRATAKQEKERAPASAQSKACKSTNDQSVSKDCTP